MRLTYVDRDPQYVFRGPAPVNEVDKQVFAKQQALQLQPAQIASDAVFVLPASGGVPVTKLKAGRYRFTVADKSSTRSFVVQRKGASATTVSGVAFVGTRTVVLTLTAGQWTFYTSAGAKSASAFTVTA